MKIGVAVRLLSVFAVAFSLFTISGGTIGPGQVLPRLAHAANAPNEPWYPAGPAMDTLTYTIFVDESHTEQAIISNPPEIDFADWPLNPNSIFSNVCASSSFLCTSPLSDRGYFELEFMMTNNYWGCQFNFGNAACGTHIRQAFAHGLDKNSFVSIELAGNAIPIDNPVPPGVSLNTPDPCGWDTLFPQTGTNCEVNGAAGTAYHLASATGGIACPAIPSLPQFQYTPGCGTPDFCAAADHLVAAGVAIGKDSATCVLTGLSSAVSSNPIQIFVRSDNTPRLHAGNSYGQFLCALLTGAYTTDCTGVSVTPGSILQFPGFTTSTTTVSNSWWVYTAGFGNVLTFDSSLYFSYQSQFVSGIPSIRAPQGSCSSGAVPTFAAGNYMYICSSSYDSFMSQAEFSPCLTAPGDPTTGQTYLNVTFTNCPGSNSLTSASSSYKAQDVFGSNAFTIPWWSGKNVFFYRTGWSRAVLDKGAGFTPPGNYFLSLNAWNPASPVPSTMRQGFPQGTGSVSPFIGNTQWDTGVIGSIWDGPGTTNPDSPLSYLDWMTVKTDQLATSALQYTPPSGTVAAFRYTLRNDIYWHTGQKLTAWDLAFTYAALKAAGVNGELVSSMTGVKVLGPNQVDVDVNGVGPFTRLFLSAPILPARDWLDPSVCPSSTWDNAANNPNFASAVPVLTACIASGGVTASGVITGISTNVDRNKIAPTYDPIASGNLIGSGPWVCQSSSGSVGSGCSSSGTQAPPTGGVWTLQRYGRGTVPGGSLNTYFRSSGNLALSIWTGDMGTFSSDFLNLASVSLCFGATPVPSNCTRWAMGIGNPNGSTSSPASIGVVQVSIVQRFVGVNWVAPYDWITSPPQNIAAFPPVLYEGAITMNPSTVAGCATSYHNGGGYDC